jgi:ABC-type phosphate/phosphonate transport system substrate-binding protein
MRKLTGQILATAAAVVLCVALFSGEASAKTYKFVVPVMEGLGDASFSKIFERMSRTLTQKTGYPVDWFAYKYDYPDKVTNTVLDKMNKGEIDFAMVVPTEYYAYAKNRKTNSKPLFSITMFGKPTFNLCFYVRKGDGITSAAQLRGKTWGGAVTRSARFLMHENGIDEPMARFFKALKFEREVSISALFESLLSRDIDVFTLPDFMVKMSIGADASYREITGIGCKEYEHHWIIVYRKGIPEDDATKMKTVFLRMDRDKDFAELQFLLKAVKGKFIDINASEFKVTAKVANYWEKYDWLKEEDEFLKKNMK